MTPTEVHALAVAHGLDHEQAITATAIAWEESGLNPEAVGDKALVDDTWGPSIGLWQIRSLNHQYGTGIDRDGERLPDPDFNARAMVAISVGGTKWTPWSVYKSGVYRRRLDAVRAAVEGEPLDPAGIIRAAMDDLERQGVRVAYEDGWEDRGRPGSFTPQGVVCHHTATRGYDRDYPSMGIVRDGRSDLPGPLSQFGIGRITGTVYVIAAGKANHAGPGGWRGLSGNGTVWGIEAENDGVGEGWSAPTLKAYVALCAALARHTGFGPEMVCAHREWNPQDKIDPTGIDMPSFRKQVAAALGGTPTPPTEELPMEFTYIAHNEDWVVSTSARFAGRLPFGDTLDGLKEGKQLVNLGKRSAEFHKGVVEFANQCGFVGDR